MPRSSSAEQQIQRASERSAEPATCLPAQLDVLIVDNDDASREALRAAIVRLGHRCRSAETGREAIKAHRERRADVIVSDWRIPGIDAMDLCRRVRALDGPTYTYVLVVSARAEKRDFIEAVRAGAEDYLPKPVDPDDLEARLIAAGRVVHACRQLAERNVVLRHDSQAFFRVARIDALTQVANRLKLEEDLEALQAHVSRYRRRTTVAMCDLDSFKLYNDRYGHLVGDDALRRVAHAIRSNVRRADQVYRYGGEEFLIIMPEQSPADVAVALERVRAAVEGLALAHAPRARHPVLTLSIGVAAIDPVGHDSVRDAIALADEALYGAKASGGNGVRRAPRIERRLAQGANDPGSMER
jgi:diguanylate cyclase (GGDEF)-like protein